MVTYQSFWKKKDQFIVFSEKSMYDSNFEYKAFVLSYAGSAEVGYKVPKIWYRSVHVTDCSAP